MSKRNKPTKHKACCFCGLSRNNEFEFGKLYEQDDIVTHYYCLLLSSNMQQRGKDDQGIQGFLLADIRKEIRRGKKLTCIYCKKTGATLGCCNVKCKRIFHYPCGLRAGTLNQFFGEFRSYCRSHRPKPKIDAQVKEELDRTNETICYICYEKVDPCDIVSTIWAPCCKKNAWFHRKCVQQLAASAGYFFKCPLCNDNKTFQKAMLEFGIFIPSQDASWELVPNAFQELLFRHDQCDAPICLCPKGRKYTSVNAKWELALCRTCGSQGIHMACGQLKWASPVWECSDCISILGKSTEAASCSKTEDLLQKDSGSDDSDSDISVGKDSPVPYISPLPIISSKPQESNVKSRPGPRTFKLRQLKAHMEMQKDIKEQDTENTNGTLYSKTEEHSLQSTSNEQVSTNTLSCSSTNTRIPDTTDTSNTSNEHSKSQVAKAVDNAITLDSDDDIIEINHCNSLDDTLIIVDDNETRGNELLKSKNNAVKINETNCLNKLKLDQLLFKNDFYPGYSCKPLNRNTQNQMRSDALGNTMLNREAVYNYIGSPSSIKITNVVSLASEEFHALSMQQKRNVENYEFPTSKRKLEEATLSPTISQTDRSKKMKGDRELGETSSSSNIPLHNYADFVSENNNLKIHNNGSNTSVNVSNLHSQGSCIQVKKSYSKNILHTSNENNALEIEVDNSTTNCDGGAGTDPAVEPRNGSISNDTKIDCGEELLTSGHSRTAKEQLLEQRKSQDNSKMAIPKRRTSGNKSISVYQQEESRNTGCNYPGLIPEFVNLRDLKFRVHNLNNLQMILYDKFSVNINMESANTMIKNTRLDASTKKTAQQNVYNTQTFRSGNVLQSISSVCNKDKSKHMVVNEQLENYEDSDDGKENLDPVTTIPCKIITDNVVTNTTLIANDSSASANGHNKNEKEDLTQPMFNTIEDDDEEHSYKNISVINANECIFDASTSCKNKYIKSNNCAIEIIQKLKCDSATNSALEMYSTKASLEGEFHDSMKLVRRALFSENHTNCALRNNIETINNTDLKVSIDLRKIENFIDGNPDLFSRHKEEDKERYFERTVFLKDRKNVGEELNMPDHIANRDIDETKHLEKSTLIDSIRIGRSRMVKLRSHRSEIANNLEGVMTDESLIQQTGHTSNSSNDKKSDLEGTNGPFEK